MKLPIETLLTGGRLAAFARGPGGYLGRTWQLEPNGRWSTWKVVGPRITGVPAAAQNADGHVDVFAIGADGALGNMWQEAGYGGWWSAWARLGPRIRSDPVVVQNGEGRLELFAIGADGQLGHMWQHPRDVGGWSPWETIGPTLRSEPTAFLKTDGRLEVFAAGPDGLLGHVWQQVPELGGWATWEDFETEISGKPAVFTNGHGLLEVFGVGPGGRLGHMWQHEEVGGGWSSWDDFGVEISGGPVVFANADGRLEVFGAGVGGRLGHMWQLRGAHGWSSWDDFGVEISGDPSVFANADGRLELMASGPDGLVGHIGQRGTHGGSGWSDWKPVGPEITAGGVALCQCDDRGLLDRELLASAEQRSRSSWQMLLPTSLSADVCVVGAGPAGITLADGLLRAGASVVMLESGGWVSDEITEELNRGAADGPLIKDYGRYLSDARSRQVQGAAAKWGPGWMMRFRQLDLEQRSWLELSGWPLSSADLAPYETQATATFGFARFEPPLPRGPLVQVSYHFPPEPQLFRAKFLELLAHPRFHVELGATVVELEADGGRVSVARCARPAGGQLRVTANTFVLACGGIENARMLLLNEQALQTGNEMTGRCFMEHPHVHAGTVRVPDAQAMRDFFYGAGDKLDVLALPDEAQRERGLLNATVQIRRERWDTEPHEPVHCTLYVRAEQSPNPYSRVVLGERSDRFRCRQPVLHWRTTERDWDSVVETAEIVADSLEKDHGALPRVEIGSDSPWPWDPVPLGPGSERGTWGYHTLGTTRMSDSPDEGVVDRNCLVYGTENLYAAGSSVFTTGSCANPTFMIVMLAHRLADHLGRV